MIKYIAGFGCAMLLLTACKKKQESTSPIEEKITESVYASGIVKSKLQYQVFSTVNGIVAALLVTEGDMVKKGDPIIRITNTTAQLNVENASIAADYTAQSANTEKLRELNISIEQAKVKLDNDALLQQRQRNLWAQQIGTKNELDQRELAYKTSQNNYEAAKLRYTELQKQIAFQAKQSQKSLQISKTVAADYTIKSEADGKVYNILKEKGEMVNTQTPVALVGDGNAFTLELQVDEYDITRIIPGQKILLSMDSYKGQVFDAVVVKINPAMNERSKSFTIDAAFVKQPPALYPSLTCEANIVIQTKDKVLTIPRNYLMEGDVVLLQNKEKRKVTTGLKDYQKVEILSGLTVKDIILKPVL
jgi:multidrug efflux pump subunit AcrA (membrane-fusion protein)